MKHTITCLQGTACAGQAFFRHNLRELWDAKEGEEHAMLAFLDELVQ